MEELFILLLTFDLIMVVFACVVIWIFFQLRFELADMWDQISFLKKNND